MVATKDLISELQLALKEEIEQVKPKGDARYLVMYGRLVRRHAEFSIYELALDDILEAPDDSPVVLQVGNQSVKGTLVSSTGFNATVEVEGFLGEDVPQAYLVISPVFLLERLVEVLEELKLGKRTAFWDTINRVFGGRFSPIRRSWSFTLTVNRASQGIDPSQREAVAAAMGSATAVVWGPPGTGKTTTLGLIVDAFLHAGLRVLVVSHTNIAVDQAMLKVLDACEGTTRVEEGIVLRFGGIAVKEADEAKRLERISSETMLEALREELEGEVGKLKDQEKRLEAEKAAWDALSRAIKQRDEARLALLRAELIEKELEAKRAELAQRMQIIEEERRNLSEQLAELEGGGLVGRLIASAQRRWLGAKREALAAEWERTKQSWLAVLEHLTKQAQDVARAKERLIESQRNVTELSRRLGARIDEVEVAQRKGAELAARLCELRARIEELSGRRAPSVEEVVARARVVGTTLTKCYLSRELQDQRFDVVIVDEASMAPLPSVYYALGLARKKVVIVGDFKQLPPIAQADGEYARKWLKRDVFDLLGIDGSDTSKCVLLGRQYRMHPLIASVANQLFYDGKLRNGSKAITRAFHGAFGVLALIDSGTVRPWCFRAPDHTRFNIMHALAVVAVRERLVAKGLSPGELGIVAPYRGQARLIRKVLADLGDEETVCSTVHRFQGREKNAIIMDLTDAYPERVGRLLRGTGSEVGKLLNVAVTRAKDVLVVVADKEYFRRESGVGWQVLKVLETVQDRGNVYDIQSVLQEELASVLLNGKGAGHIGRGGVYFQLFFEDVFVAVAKRVAENAERRVVVAGPGAGTKDADLFGILERVCRDRNIRRILLTGRPSDGGLERLKKVGVKIGKARVGTRLVLVDANVLIVSGIAEGGNRRRIGIALYGAENTIEELLKLWKLQGVIRELEDEANPVAYLNGRKLERDCPRCGQGLRIIVGRYGPYVRCSGLGCDHKESLSDNDLDGLIPPEMKVCERGHRMVVKRSWKGPRKGVPFLGCSEYPDCRAAKSLSRSRAPL